MVARGCGLWALAWGDNDINGGGRVSEKQSRLERRRVYTIRELCIAETEEEEGIEVHILYRSYHVEGGECVVPRGEPNLIAGSDMKVASF